MSLPRPRQALIAGIIDDVRRAGSLGDSGDPTRRDSVWEASALPRAHSVPNPFASFYEQRRRLSAAATAGGAFDPASRTTRAHIVADASRALRRAASRWVRLGRRWRQRVGD